jgi:phospholipid/cholesterol/gamma-HCH transport system substrate-binding protein
MRMRKRALADLALLLAFAVFCIGGLGYLAKGMGMPVPFTQQGWILKAKFANADGLVPQSDVYESGVHVGKVLSMQPAGTKGAVVTMRIDPGVSLHQDVDAYVQPKTAIGDTYINLVRTPNSTAPMVTSGYVIPLAHTGQSVQLDQILNNMDPTTRAAMSQSLQQLGVAVSGRSSDIQTTIPQLNQVLANLQPIVQVGDARQRDLNQILVNLAVIMRSLAQEQQSLGQLVNSGDTAMGAIASRDQSLGGTVRQADQLMTSLDTILRGLTPADRASLQASPPTLQAGLKLLSQLNPVIDRLLPELLLAQVNYPNNQNAVASTGSESVAQEWISAFSQRDSQGNSMRITPVADLGNAVKLPIPLPGQQGGQSSGTGSTALPPASTHISPQIPSKDASGNLIPSVAQMLLELPL